MEDKCNFAHGDAELKEPINGGNAQGNSFGGGRGGANRRGGGVPNRM